jgi:hypothetical protein
LVARVGDAQLEVVRLVPDHAFVVVALAPIERPEEAAVRQTPDRGVMDARAHVLVDAVERREDRAVDLVAVRGRHRERALRLER